MMPPRGVSTSHRIQTKFGRTGNFLTLSPTPNIKSFEIKLWLWRRVEVSCFRTSTAHAINTAKPCRAACDRSGLIIFGWQYSFMFLVMHVYRPISWFFTTGSWPSAKSPTWKTREENYFQFSAANILPKESIWWCPPEHCIDYSSKCYFFHLIFLQFLLANFV